jgi:hypothetical protein
MIEYLSFILIFIGCFKLGEWIGLILKPKPKPVIYRFTVNEIHIRYESAFTNSTTYIILN